MGFLRVSSESLAQSVSCGCVLELELTVGLGFTEVGLKEVRSATILHGCMTWVYWSGLLRTNTEPLLQA